MRKYNYIIQTVFWSLLAIAKPLPNQAQVRHLWYSVNQNVNENHSYTASKDTDCNQIYCQVPIGIFIKDQGYKEDIIALHLNPEGFLEFGFKPDYEFVKLDLTTIQGTKERPQLIFRWGIYAIKISYQPIDPDYIRVEKLKNGTVYLNHLYTRL